MEQHTLQLEKYVAKATGGGLREHDVGILKLKQVSIVGRMLVE